MLLGFPQLPVMMTGSARGGTAWPPPVACWDAAWLDLVQVLNVTYGLELNSQEVNSFPSFYVLQDLKTSLSQSCRDLYKSS